MRITASKKVASHHNERRPADVMGGQYSVPFALAVAAWRDPAAPAAFAQDCLRDPAIVDLAARIELAAGDGAGWGAELSITLHDGRSFAGRSESFLGCPEKPMSVDDVAAKFRKLTGATQHAETLLQRLLDIENVADVGALAF
jgi:2-methylcitrate dehydratase PrpD